VRAFTGNATTVPNATTTGVVPGQFTDTAPWSARWSRRTSIRLMDGPLNYFVRMRRSTPAAEYERGRLLVEYTGSIATTHLNNGQGIGRAQYAHDAALHLRRAGWILDRTQSDPPEFMPERRPRFHQSQQLPPAPTASCSSVTIRTTSS
jgi:hypothetical protein